MSGQYTPPQFKQEAFNCPHCGAYAHQLWIQTSRHTGGGISSITDLHIALCGHCTKYSVWVKDELIYPYNSPAPLPIEDMPEEVKEVFLEARDVVNRSPRGAAALLRLALQLLLPHLGETGKDIDGDIRRLVKKGLPETSQQSLDALRVIGNHAIHPGQIDLKDDRSTAVALFRLINWIIEDQIKKVREIKEIYNLIPSTKREEIDRKDGRVSKNSTIDGSDPT